MGKKFINVKIRGNYKLLTKEETGKLKHETGSKERTRKNKRKIKRRINLTEQVGDKRSRNRE